MTSTETTTGVGTESRSTRTVRNVAWLGGTQAIRQVVAIATTVVVARFLSPSDYGLFAMTLFINELAQLLVDFGIGSALVQRKQVDQKTLSTCFWINVGVAMVAAAATVGSGPWAVAYFKQPVLAHLLWMSALNLAVSALAVIPQSLLARQLDFRNIALGTALGSLLGALVAVGLAASGAGVWALVAQPLIGTVINLAYLQWCARWLPSAQFDLPSVKGLLGFSGHLLLSNLVNHFSRNLQQLILGPAMGVTALGLLSMAQTIAWLPIAQFTAAAVRALFPAFAQIQESRERIEAGLAKAIEIVAFLTFPTLVGLAVLADDLVPVVFGAQWIACVSLVAVFSAASLVQCIANLAGSSLLATGRSDLAFKLSLLSLVVAGAVLLALRHTTLLQVSIGMAVSAMLVSLIGFGVALSNLGASWRNVVAVTFMPLLLSVTMGALLVFSKVPLHGLPAGVRLAVLLVLGGVSYLGMSWVANRRSMSGLIALVRRLV